MNKSIHILFFIALLLSSLTASAQTKTEDFYEYFADEDKQLFIDAKEKLHRFKIDSAFTLYYEAINRSEKKNDPNLKANAYNSLVQLFNFKGQIDSLHLYALKLLDLLENDQLTFTDDLQKTLYSESYGVLSLYYYFESQYDTALVYINKSLEIDQSLKDSASLPFNFAEKADILNAKLKYDAALESLFKGINYLRKGKDDFKKASLYDQIATVFSLQNNIPKAENYFEKALKACEENNLVSTKSQVLKNYGNLLEKKEDYNGALTLYEEAYNLSHETKKYSLRANTLLGLANCYLEKKQVEKADLYLNEYLSIEEHIGLETIKNAYTHIFGKRLIQTDDPRGIIWLENAYQVATDNKYLYRQKNISKLLSDYYAKTGKDDKAYALLANYNVLRDSIYNLQQTFIIEDLEAKYLKKEQENEIAYLASENSLKTARLKTQRIILLLIGIACLVFFILTNLLIKYFQKAKQQKEIAEKSLKEKNILLKEIHHRVKNNLQIISSLLALQSKYIRDDSALNALKQGQDRVQSMALIHQDLYQNENLKGVSVHDYFEQLIDNLFDSYNISEDSVELQMDVENLNLDVDTMIPLGLVINELVSNSLKHAFQNNENGILKVNLKEDNNALVLQVIDNGKNHVNVDQLEGKSFGFSLVKAFAHKLKAEIEINHMNGLNVTLRIHNYKIAA